MPKFAKLGASQGKLQSKERTEEKNEKEKIKEINFVWTPSGGSFAPTFPLPPAVGPYFFRNGFQLHNITIL